MTFPIPTSPNNEIADFVFKNGGHHVISKVLIANNGIAAVKEIRSVRKWAYETFGNERAIEFTVMVTPEDLQANAEYIRMADHYFEVPGGSNNNNYANVNLIVDVAERAGVHAVWAGWGHASENPKLPDALLKSPHGIVFIGPPSSAMRSLGDKISSTILAQSAKVPTMSWSGNDLIIETSPTSPTSEYIQIPQDLYLKACVQTAEEGLASANKIGFPVMIKASEGGGGKGIRKVIKEEDFNFAFEQCCREVPGSPVFIMKLAGNARHLEVQILADQYGNAISLFGRDCSVQRRHQKIIEEAPVSIAPAETFEKMEKAAVRLAQLVGYVSAGTVEYLYEPDTGNFYFLELNPRLQVEHPCTEIISGVNLPAAQLQIAMGLPLHKIRDIRLLYGMSPNSGSLIDFNFSNPMANSIQRKPQPKGHVIATRITAENPDAGFKPNSGRMQELNFRSSTNVWGYFSVGQAGGLHEFADSQFGHLFAYGESRKQARKNMIMALKELSIRGDFRTTVEYLIKLLETEEFSQNKINTGWLDSLISNNMKAERPHKFLAVICGAVSKAFKIFHSNTKHYVESLKRGQPPSREYLKTELKLEIFYENFRYDFVVSRFGPEIINLFINETLCQVHCRQLNDGGLLILFDGKSHTVYAREEGNNLRVMIDGKTCVLEGEFDPTKLRTPSPGKLIRYLYPDGSRIQAGSAYAEIEVMKMCLPLVAVESGIVNWTKQEGSVLGFGEIIGTLKLEDESHIKKATPYTEPFPQFLSPFSKGEKPYQVYQQSRQSAEWILEGFDSTYPYKDLVKKLIFSLRNPQLPFSIFEKNLSFLAGRLPSQLDQQIHSVIDRCSNNQFPAKKLLKVIHDFQMKMADINLNEVLSPLVDILNSFTDGLKDFERKVMAELLNKFTKVELYFDDLALAVGSREKTRESILLNLRETYKDDLETVVQIARSHSKVSQKVQLVLEILNHIDQDSNDGPSGLNLTHYTSSLKKIANLNSPKVVKCAMKARSILLKKQKPSQIRNIEPEMASLLELERLSNFKIEPVLNLDYKHLFIYQAKAKNCPVKDDRFFLRILIKPELLNQSNLDKNETAEYLISLADDVIKDGLDALEVMMPQHPQADCNHFFIHFIPQFEQIASQDVEEALPGFIQRHGLRLWRLRVTSGEIRIAVNDNGIMKQMRIFLQNVSGYVVKIETYFEHYDEATGKHVLKSIQTSLPGSLQNQPVHFPYPPQEGLQPKRYKAHLMGTTYVYDFPELFRQAIHSRWSQFPQLQKPKNELLDCKELILTPNSELIQTYRPPGQNDIGMVGWLMSMKSPECERQIIVIANDITFQIGSFGPKEDLFFYKCTQLARRMGVPRIYLSANSGARIGVAEEVFELFMPKFSTNGGLVEYLYLDQEGYHELSRLTNGHPEHSVHVTPIQSDNGEWIYKIEYIIGIQDGLGVENLKGSALIAAETTKAYRDIVTFTLVTCRSVGIGAYLVRLGHRTIQIQGHPIILTGMNALNKVLGREVYTSNLQLGGTQIMFGNGVSHLIAQDDYEGVVKMMEWLSYIPKCRDGGPCVSPCLSDPIERDVEFMPPSKSVYDIRDLINGAVVDGEYKCGLFDHNSFRETLSGWAKSVVVGRARLGGYPIAIIASELQTTQSIIPADPANPLSHEQSVIHPGGVLFPDSSYKFAQSLKDFQGEQLPLFILANWRGFSGGMMDMYNQILKYGSMMVDGMVDYEWPVFIYIPPGGELRGGAWVVLDSWLNSSVVEMFADVEGRGGVLEKEGVVEIKLRTEKILQLMSRLDTTYSSLKKQLLELDSQTEEYVDVQEKIKEREKKLLPLYYQIALQFVDCHDRPGRMFEKGLIDGIVSLREARRFFYWRLRRRLEEMRVKRRISQYDPGYMEKSKFEEVLKQWIPNTINSDREKVEWFEKEGERKVEELCKQLRIEKLRGEIQKCMDLDMEGTVDLMGEFLGGNGK